MKKISNEEYILKAKNVHGDKFEYTNTIYKNGLTKIKIICTKHGEFEQYPQNHLTGKHGCKICYYNSKNLKNEDFIQKARIIFPNYDYIKTNYINAYKKVIIICQKHGEFNKVPNDLLRKKTGCPSCGMIKTSCSKKSKLWLESFKNKNIIYEYYLKELKIFVDGFDPITNTVYEFDGDYWHGNPYYFLPNDINKRNKKTFGELYNKTIERQKSIKNLGYNLVNIWASEFKHYELYQKG